MITRMTKYSFVLFSGDKDSFLEKLQELGVVDISRSSKPVDGNSTAILARMEKIKTEINSIVKGSDDNLVGLEARLAGLLKEEAELAPWGDYDSDALAALGLPVHFYSIAAKRYDPEWESLWAVQKISEEDGKVFFVIIGNADGCPVKELPAPRTTLGQLQKEIGKVREDIDSYSAALASRKADIPSLRKEYDDTAAELGRYLADAAGTKAAEDSLVIFEGFSPTENDAELKAALDGMDVIYLDAPATSEDKPPIKLRNNWFSRQFEVLTSMYGMPVYDEFDPTILLSIFFLLFFAMCMGDAGYGILLIAIGLFMKGKEGGLAKLWSLIITLGAATFVVGIVMGGFFGVDLSTQAWVHDGLKKIMITGDITVGGSSYAKQMVLSLGIGILHICLALIVKTVWTIRNNGVKNSLGTIGWTLLIVGGIIALAIGLTGVISESAMKWTLIIIAGVSALGIYFFNKWGRNPLVNLGAGLWDTYNTASGLMGDVLSYIRLYALGLSGGMLGSTFNQIAEMVKGSDPTWQWVPFVIILLIGHTLNLAMSCLGAFVHPLRLNFVEFFKNSDYQGRGTQYNPLKK